MTDKDDRRTPGWRAQQGTDDFHGLDVHRSESTEGLFDVEDELAIFAVPIPGGPDLQAAAKIHSATRLRVYTHGAIRLPRDRYPRFDGVSESLQGDDAFVSFADPTLLLSSDMTLGWYTGAREWDPHELMIETVREALRASGADELFFIGVSGGGFAALRMSIEFPGSAAFVLSPQTSLPRSRGDHFATLLAEGYDGVSAEEACNEFPGRFEVVNAYSEGFPNAVYYLQNLGDPSHVGSHYNPIRRAVGIRTAEGIDPTGRFEAVLEDLERQGQGPPTRAEFDHHLERASKFFREGPPREPEHLARSVLELRHEVAELRRAVDEIGDYSKRSHRAVLRELGILPWSTETLSRVAAELIPHGRPLPAVGSYALRTAAVEELIRTIRVTQPSQVVECGSGSSTAWIALCLESIGKGHLTSLESGDGYARRTRELLEELGVSHRVSVVDAPLAASEIAGGETWYDIPDTTVLPDSIDVLLVDGPPSSGGARIREPAMTALYPRLAVDAVVLVDDADRPDERAMIEHWIEAFDLVHDERTANLVTLRPNT